MHIAWFSAGVTSSVAVKIALEMYDDVAIYYFDTGMVHPDNKRFIAQCQEWYGQEIIIRKSEKYTDPFDVIKKRRYINGPKGALCTMELKKEVRFTVENELKQWDGQIFGFEFSQKEVNRAIRFSEQYTYAKGVFPLIERKITKPNCIALLEQAGIERPAMYKLGYHNNNCIGCVKGGMGYWNKIRKDFPEIFQRMSDTELELENTCLRKHKGKDSFPLYLKDLDPSAGRGMKDIDGECGVVCATEFTDLIDPRTAMVISGELKISEIDWLEDPPDFVADARGSIDIWCELKKMGTVKIH